MNVVDLFAGLGGFSEGAEQAGCKVIYAANHWKAACDMHKLNHPDTDTVCQDLRQADFTQMPKHDLLLASPACQGHSVARGKDKPKHDADRSTAWAVVEALECHKTPAALVENVPEFVNWVLYPSWVDALRRLGYSVAPHFLNTKDSGVPQDRPRVFIAITRGAHPLVLQLPKRAEVPVSRVIEWDAHSWSAVYKPGRAPATIARYENAKRNGFGERFVMPYYGSGSGLTGRSIDRPLGTVTTRDRWALVEGGKMRMLQPSEYRAVMSFPKNYRLPETRTEAIFMLGNAVAPRQARDVINELRRAA